MSTGTHATKGHHMAITDLPEFIRADGPDKVTGSGRYTADMTLTGQLVAKFKYAKISHARIVKLDVSAARAVPGVFAVITSDDVPDIRVGYGLADRRMFAKDVVRFEGEVVAAVAAISNEAAERALDAIVFEYEELPVTVDLEAAIAEGAPLVHTDVGSYVVTGDTPHDGNVATHSSIEMGDPDAAMASADVVVSSRYVADASHAAPIEPRAVIAQWEGDKVTVWTSTQVPFEARAGVCETLEMPSNRVRIIAPHVGGGFGGKCGAHFEPHIAALARVAKRPVKLVFSRWEEFVAPDRRREGMIIDITTGVSSDGSIVARTGNILLDNGAYMADSSFFAQVASMHIAGPYAVPNVRIDGRLVYTNHQPSGSVRAPTAPQGCWALESHTDEVAAAVGMDPLDFRRKNIVRTGSVGAVGQTYDEIGLDQCLELAAKSAGWGQDLPDGEALGISVGWWPSFASPAGAYAKMHGDGSVQIVTGASECGTGSVMTLRMIAADELGLDQTDVELVYQDTGVAPLGPGSSGSQTLFNHGRAVEKASGQIGAQLKELAAAELEANVADIVLAGGRASVAGSPTASVSILELAASSAEGEILGSASADALEWPEITGSTCLGDQGFSSWLAPQFSCHVARVRVDKDTGVSRVLEIHAAHDSGTIINPLAAHGQVEGGVLMGIGQALTEGTQYDEDGRQRNAALLEYKLQTIADVPEITTQFVEIFTPNAGPRGAKGLAEAPNVATCGAISNAIAAAIGTRVRQLPMTAERVWEAIDSAQQGSVA
ncbi:MAG: CO/xanthine dehydrogenase Mo-binding subunit [Verrucomicrobiales bacterium]|jgi:CO/xanthine dehydrogenase Mo-binding subunit